MLFVAIFKRVLALRVALGPVLIFGVVFWNLNQIMWWMKLRYLIWWDQTNGINGPAPSRNVTKCCEHHVERKSPPLGANWSCTRGPTSHHPPPPHPSHKTPLLQQGWGNKIKKYVRVELKKYDLRHHGFWIEGENHHKLAKKKKTGDQRPLKALGFQNTTWYINYDQTRNLWTVTDHWQLPHSLLLSTQIWS